MTIIVEDGTIVTNANSYVTTAELDTYATARGVTIISGDREKYLLLAMDYLEPLRFIGTKYSATQALQWPRSGAYIDGYLLDEDAIPTLLKNAEMQIAMSISEGYSPVAVIERATKKEKVGPLEVEYQAGAASSPIDPKIGYSIQKLIVGGGIGNTVTVIKA